MLKVLFLDIDGVLNSQDNQDSLLLLDRSKDFLFDRRCCNWLNYIHAKTNCCYVISSNWREDGLESMQSLFKREGILGEVIDITPFSKVSLKTLNQKRGLEIKSWLDNNVVDKYCIVDDNDNMLIDQNFVKTDYKFGLTKLTVKQILKKLC